MKIFAIIAQNYHSLVAEASLVGGWGHARTERLVRTGEE
jgi:hypothetical protein